MAQYILQIARALRVLVLDELRVRHTAMLWLLAPFRRAAIAAGQIYTHSSYILPIQLLSEPLDMMPAGLLARLRGGLIAGDCYAQGAKFSLEMKSACEHGRLVNFDHHASTDEMARSLERKSGA